MDDLDPPTFRFGRRRGKREEPEGEKVTVGPVVSRLVPIVQLYWSTLPVGDSRSGISALPARSFAAVPISMM